MGINLNKYPKELYQSPIYKTWSCMKYRCTNTNAPDYFRYGGRGIKVCDRWNKFANFYADMGDTHIDGYSIDRIDNNGNYEPGNCKWSNKTQQANNRRTNTVIEINGTKKTFAQWVRHYGIIKPSTVRQRYYCMGWDIVKSLTFQKGKV
jgi:hypothetical protein